MSIAEPDYPHFIAVNRHGFYCVPEAYRALEVPQVLAAGGVYEADTIALIQRLCGTGDVIAGGAFVGDFLPALEAGLAPGAQLHSFEPNPVSRAATEMTIALNGLTKVRLTPCAVGAEDGSLPLKVATASGDAMGARAKIAEGHVEGETIAVPVRRLDDLVPSDRRVTVLQLDIEGHERPALEGASALVHRDRPAILVEAPKKWHRRTFVELFAERFTTLNYRYCGQIDHNAVFRTL